MNLTQNLTERYKGFKIRKIKHTPDGPWDVTITRDNYPIAFRPTLTDPELQKRCEAKEILASLTCSVDVHDNILEARLTFADESEEAVNKTVTAICDTVDKQYQLRMEEEKKRWPKVKMVNDVPVVTITVPRCDFSKIRPVADADIWNFTLGMAHAIDKAKALNGRIAKFIGDIEFDAPAVDTASTGSSGVSKVHVTQEFELETASRFLLSDKTSISQKGWLVCNGTTPFAVDCETHKLQIKFKISASLNIYAENNELSFEHYIGNVEVLPCKGCQLLDKGLPQVSVKLKQIEIELEPRQVERVDTRDLPLDSLRWVHLEEADAEKKLTDSRLICCHCGKDLTEASEHVVLRDIEVRIPGPDIVKDYPCCMICYDFWKHQKSEYRAIAYRTSTSEREMERMLHVMFGMFTSEAESKRILAEMVKQNKEKHHGN